MAFLLKQLQLLQSLRLHGPAARLENAKRLAWLILDTLHSFLLISLYIEKILYLYIYLFVYLFVCIYIHMIVYIYIDML